MRPVPASHGIVIRPAARVCWVSGPHSGPDAETCHLTAAKCSVESFQWAHRLARPGSRELTGGHDLGLCPGKLTPDALPLSPASGTTVAQMAGEGGAS